MTDLQPAPSLEDEHAEQGVYACEHLKAGQGCIDGRLYGPCGEPGCEGVCIDMYGACRCRCHREDDDA